MSENTIQENIAYLTAPSGRRYQVLNSEGTGWDEEATVQAYKAGEGIADEPKRS